MAKKDDDKANVVEFKRVNEFLGKISRAVNTDIDNSILESVGEQAINLILARTKKGLDASGKGFKKYSPSYTEYRERAGYLAQVDLARTGHMLNSLVPEVTGENEVTISFNDNFAALKGAVHNYGSESRNIPQREFLDIRQDREIESIENVFIEDLVKRIEKAFQ